MISTNKDRVREIAKRCPESQSSDDVLCAMLGSGAVLVHLVDYRAIGMDNVNLLPLPSSDSTLICPLCSWDT